MAQIAKMMPPPMGQSGTMQPQFNQGGMMPPQLNQVGMMGQNGMMQPHLNQGGMMPPQINQGGAMPPQISQGGMMPPSMGQNGTMQSQFNQGGMMPPSMGQSGTMPPQSNQSGMTPSNTYKGEMIPPSISQNGTIAPQSNQGGMMPPQMNKGGMMPPSMDQRGTMPPQSNQGGMMPPQPSQGGSMHPQMSQGGMMPPSMPPQMNQGGTMPPHQNQGGTMHPQMSQSGMMPPSMGPSATLNSQSNPRGMMHPQMNQGGMMPPSMNQNGPMPPQLNQGGMMPPSMGQVGTMPPQPSQGGSMHPQMSQGGMMPPSMPPQMNQGGMMPPQMSHGGMMPPSMPPQMNQGGMMPPQVGQGGMMPPPIGQGGMMPPQVGQGGMMPPGGQPYGPQSGPMAQSAAQQQKRLDPNMMPSAVQVMEDDRRAHSGVFPTGFPRAELPPLVTSDFFCEDHGNCFPKFLRSTLYAGPANNDLLKQSAVPLALCICPIAKLDPRERILPIVNLGELGPVRCTRCKAYMCPFMEFKDGGRRFRCPFCKSTTEVPTEYFAHLDQNGQRTDTFERPELCLGSYEFVATKEYCKNNLFPKPPAFIFMLDVSYNAVRNGMVKLFCDNIKSLVQNLPKEMNMDRSAIDIGFATYDQSVHFYNLKSALGQPKMLIVNDVQDTFVPLVDGFLVNLQECEAVIDTLLAQIPQMFADTKVTEIVLGPAIQAGLDALKSSDRPGKLFVFHTSLPTYDAPGKLKNRDDRQVLGTEKEKTVLLPQSEFYNKLAQDCVGAGCSVDVFLFPNSYADVATIGCLCGMTGGQLYKYQYFQADTDGERFLADLKHDIERPVVFDAIMRVRTSTGIRPTDFYGNFYMSNTTDVELAALDCDKTITVEIKHDDKIEDQAVCFQVALLFTSVGGQRRLRIHNLSIAVGTDLASLYRSADLFTVVNYLAKQGERLLLQKSPRDVRESMVNRCAQILATYRQHCSPGSSLGQLVLPETMKLLPLLVNCIIKHSAFTGGSDLTIDDKAWLMQILPSMTPLDTVYYFYPRVLPVYEFVEDGEEVPTPVRCSYENLCSTGAYLFENGIVILFWIGLGVSQQWVQDVFGVQNFAQINAEKHDLPEKDNSTSRNLRKLLNRIQSEKCRCMKLYIIKQQDKLEPWFRKFMVEDKGSDSSPSYVEFLCHVHKEIRNLLS